MAIYYASNKYYITNQMDKKFKWYEHHAAPNAISNSHRTGPSPSTCGYIMVPNPIFVIHAANASHKSSTH